MEEEKTTCRECAFYRSSRKIVYGKKPKGPETSGICTCWNVKGRNGDYLPVKSSQPACPHYMPGALTINPME